MRLERTTILPERFCLFELVIYCLGYRSTSGMIPGGLTGGEVLPETPKVFINSSFGILNLRNLMSV
jgi:hypothetical protein